MREFTATELGNRTRDVLEAARHDIVSVTRHGKRQFVMMSAAAYDVLLAGGDPALMPEPETQGDLWGDDMDLLDDG